MTAGWRNRIVGQGEEAPDQLLANPRNWRIHPKAQQDALAGALDQVGWVQQVIVNRRTGMLVDGHLRVELAISRNEPTVPVVYVDLSPEEEALVLASIDPISAMAGRDDEKLRQLLAEVEFDSRELADALAKVAGVGADELYTDAVNVPRYEPTGERPEPDALYDESKAERLRKAIREADLDDATRAFLTAAAARHVVFDYGLVAEFYAHAPADVQRLMEASALVIVDLDNAIRDGYVSFLDAVARLRGEDDESDA